MNLPNKLSILRLILIPVLVALFYIDFPFHYLSAAVVFTIASLTDFLDGHIARKYNLVTDFGKFLDSSADKVLVLVTLVVICTSDILPKAFMGIGTSVIIAREILISCLRMVAAAKGLVLAADKFGKAKTLFQDLTIVAVLVLGDFLHLTALLWVCYVLFGIAIILTIVSGLNYFIRNKKTLKMIQQ